MTEPENEIVNQSTATEEYLKNRYPKLWGELSALSPKEQDGLWPGLTQEHLGPYEQARAAGPQAVEELLKTPKFQEEEEKLKLLNFFFTESLPQLDPHLPQTGWISLPQRGILKFAVLKDLFDGVLEAKKQRGKRPFSIMVTGVGGVGKATTRAVLSKGLIDNLPEEVVDDVDMDYEKLPPQSWDMSVDIRVVEDVHGLDKNNQGVMERFDGPAGLPGGYDLVVYVLRLPPAYKQSLLNRGIAWVKGGKIDLTEPGEKTPESFEEVLQQAADKLEGMDEDSRSWNKEYLATLRELRQQGKAVAIVDPNGYLEALGYTKRAKDLSGKSFHELLRERFGTS